MGAMLDCFRGSTNEQNPRSNNIATPNADARREAAAQAAQRRVVLNETRGVDEDALRQMKQRQNDLKKLEEQQATHARQNANDNGGGLRWQMN